MRNMIAEFVRLESFAGALLALAAAAAIVIANTRLGASVEALFHVKLALGFGTLTLAFEARYSPFRCGSAC